METLGVIGILWGLYRVVLGLYRDNGRENGNYSNGIISLPWFFLHAMLLAQGRNFRQTYPKPKT